MYCFFCGAYESHDSQNHGQFLCASKQPSVNIDGSCVALRPVWMPMPPPPRERTIEQLFLNIESKNRAVLEAIEAIREGLANARRHSWNHRFPDEPEQ